jgi:hypothetical protein
MTGELSLIGRLWALALNRDILSSLLSVRAAEENPCGNRKTRAGKPQWARKKRGSKALLESKEWQS